MLLLNWPNIRKICVVCHTELFFLVYVVKLHTCNCIKKKGLLLLWVWQKVRGLEPSVTYFLCSLSSAYSIFSVGCLYSVSCTWAHRKVVRITQNILQHPDMIHFPSAVRTRRRCCRKSEANPCLVWLPYSPSHCLMLYLKVLCDVHLQKLEIQLVTRKV